MRHEVILIKDVFKRDDRVVSRTIAGETLLVPVRGNLADMERIFALDPVGDYIWTHLDGEISLEDMISGVLETFDVDKQTASVDIMVFFDELRQAGLIVKVG